MGCNQYGCWPDRYNRHDRYDDCDRCRHMGPPPLRPYPRPRPYGGPEIGIIFDVPPRFR